MKTQNQNTWKEIVLMIYFSLTVFFSFQLLSANGGRVGSQEAKTKE